MQGYLSILVTIFGVVFGGETLCLGGISPLPFCMKAWDWSAMKTVSAGWRGCFCSSREGRGFIFPRTCAYQRAVISVKRMQKKVMVCIN